MNAEPKVGDCAVIKTRYLATLMKIARVTASFVYGTEDAWARECRRDKSAILFAGTEDECRALRDRLDASERACNAERNEAIARRKKRDEELIAAATAKQQTER